MNLLRMLAKASQVKQLYYSKWAIIRWVSTNIDALASVSKVAVPKQALPALLDRSDYELMLGHCFA